jgi:hypothetical protein
MAVAFFLPPLNLFVRRSWPLTLKLYTSAGGPLAIAADDQLRAKVWSVDDAAPEIEISTDTTDSKITINDLGDSGTPASITILFHEDDTVDLLVGMAYYFELFLVDHSDADLNKPLCRADVVVGGTATGSTGP